MSSNLSSKLSYELPSHPIGEHHEALLSKTNTLFQLISLNDMGIDFLPEVIILGDCRYRYAGVEYGRGIYRQEHKESCNDYIKAVEEAPEEEHGLLDAVLVIPTASESWTNEKRDPVEDIQYFLLRNEEIRTRKRECDPEKGCGVPAQSPPDLSSAPALMHSIDLKQYTFSSFLTTNQHLDLVKIISPDKRSIVFVAEIGEDKPIVGCIATSKDMKDFLNLHPEIRITREEEYTASSKTRVGIVSRKDYGYVKEGSLVEVELGHRPPRMHNDLHNPAYMQCERCRILAGKLAEMLENPPGFEGIKVDGEHYGNKYIDFGWGAAVRVVQSLIVPCGNGTTPETGSSLVKNPDVPQEKQ